MKKLVALIMAVAIFLSIAIAEGSTFPISEEPITLTVLMPQSIQLTDAATNRMVLEYEKKTNVHIDWIFTQDKNTDLNLMMASKSYPDIFMCGLSTSQITMMSEAGMIMPLNDMIEDGTCYWYAKRLEENPLWADQLTAPDGNIYTFFISDVGDHNKCPYRMYVYTSWLNQYMDATGNEAPTTTDEFEEMLTYFRDNDMNGNGDTGDEIPLIASTDSFDNPIYYLMSAFGFVSENYHHIDNGNIVFEANTDYWREGLRWVNHLYTEGLFDAEATFVQDRTQFRALVNRQADEFIVGSVTSFWQGRFVDPSVVNWIDYTPIAPLAGPDGFAQATTNYQTYSFSCATALSSTCAYPEAAARWIDWWLSDEGSFAHTWGMVEGMDYVWTDTPSLNGDDKSVVPVEPDATGNYRIGHGNLPVYDAYNIRYASPDTEEARLTSNNYVLMQAFRLQEPFWVYSGIPQIVWCNDEDVITKVTEYQMVFKDYIETSFTEFVLGIRDINDDDQWNAYVNEFDNMGLDQYMELLEVFYQ